MHNFKQLEIWKRSMKLAKSVYQVTSSFPEAERFGIISQIRRCAVSISSNIAEGAGRNTNKAFANFLSISLGSQFELETQVLLSIDLNFISKESSEAILNELNELQKMTRSLIMKVSNV